MCISPNVHMAQSLAHEALVWRQLQHPSILPFLGIDSATFAETGYLCLVSPWMERGTLKGYMNNGEYEPERDLLRIVRLPLLQIVTD
jgi:serine/threonine protein kinase